MKKGFTLLECLTVIGILCVLLSLLLPVLTRAKVSAHQASTRSQLKQIGHSLLLYASDHNDLMPYTVGNNCYYLAVVENKLSTPVLHMTLQEVQAMSPPNLLLKRYGTEIGLYRSKLDSMPVEFRSFQHYASTWFEQTETPIYPGSSYELNSSIAISHRPLSSMDGEEFLFYSLFVSREDNQSSRYYLRADFHTEKSSTLQNSIRR